MYLYLRIQIYFSFQSDCLCLLIDALGLYAFTTDKFRFKSNNQHILFSFFCCLFYVQFSYCPYWIVFYNILVWKIYILLSKFEWSFQKSQYVSLTYQSLMLVSNFTLVLDKIKIIKHSFVSPLKFMLLLLCILFLSLYFNLHKALLF